MEAKDKAYLKELADAVEQHLLGQVQVTPETRRQAAVIEAMRYSLEAGENVFVRFGSGILPNLRRNPGAGHGCCLCH